MVSIKEQSEIEELENIIQELVYKLEISEKEKNLEISNIKKQYKKFEEEDQETIENLYRENGRLKEKIKSFKEHRELIKTNLKKKVKDLNLEINEFVEYEDRVEKSFDFRNKKIQEQKEIIENLSKKVQKLEKGDNYFDKKFQEQDKTIENLNKKIQYQEEIVESINKKIQEFENEESNEIEEDTLRKELSECKILYNGNSNLIFAIYYQKHLNKIQIILGNNFACICGDKPFSPNIFYNEFMNCSSIIKNDTNNVIEIDLRGNSSNPEIYINLIDLYFIFRIIKFSMKNSKIILHSQDNYFKRNLCLFIRDYEANIFSKFLEKNRFICKNIVKIFKEYKILERFTTYIKRDNQDIWFSHIVPKEEKELIEFLNIF